MLDSQNDWSVTEQDLDHKMLFKSIFTSVDNMFCHQAHDINANMRSHELMFDLNVPKPIEIIRYQDDNSLIMGWLKKGYF